jgi:hypothetical protein
VACIDLYVHCHHPCAAHVAFVACLQYETLTCVHEAMAEEGTRSAFVKQAQHVSVTESVT